MALLGSTTWRIAFPLSGGHKEAIISDYHDAKVKTTQTFTYDGYSIRIVPNTANTSLFWIYVDAEDGWLKDNVSMKAEMRVVGEKGEFNFYLSLCRLYSLESGSTLDIDRIVDEGDFIFGLDFNGDGLCDGGDVAYTYGNGNSDTTSSYINCYIDECCIWHLEKKGERPADPTLKARVSQTKDGITTAVNVSTWFWGYDDELDLDTDFFTPTVTDNYITSLCTGTIDFPKTVGTQINTYGHVGGVYDVAHTWKVVGYDSYYDKVIVSAYVSDNNMLYPEICKLVIGDKTIHYTIPSIYNYVKTDKYLLSFPYGGGTEQFRIYDTQRTYASKTFPHYTLTYEGVEDNIHTFTLTSDGTSEGNPDKLDIGNGFNMYILSYVMPTSVERPLSGMPYLAGDDETTISLQYEVDGVFDILIDESFNNPLGWEVISRTFAGDTNTTICTTTLRKTNDFGVRPYFNSFRTQAQSGNINNSQFNYWVVNDGASITSDDTTIPYYCNGEYMWVTFNRYIPSGFSVTGNMQVELSYTSEYIDHTTVRYRVYKTDKEYNENEKLYLNVYTEQGRSKAFEIMRTPPVCEINISGLSSYNSLIPKTNNIKIYCENIKTIGVPVILNGWKNLTLSNISEVSEEYLGAFDIWYKDRTVDLNNGLSFTSDSTAYLTVEGEGYDGKKYSATQTLTLEGANEDQRLNSADGGPMCIPLGYSMRRGTLTNKITTDTYYMDDSSIVSIQKHMTGIFEYTPLNVGETDVYWYKAPTSSYGNGTYSKIHITATDVVPTYEGPERLEVAYDEEKTFNVVIRNVTDVSVYNATVESKEIVGNDLFLVLKIEYKYADFTIELNTELIDNETRNDLKFYIPVTTIDIPSRITPEMTELDVPAGYISGSISVEYYDCGEPYEPTYPSWVGLTKSYENTTDTTRTIRYGYEIENNTGDERTGEIVFSATGNDGNILNSTVTITQQADTSKMASIALYTTNLDFNAKGGTKYLRVDYTNTSNISTPVADSWITLSESSRETVPSGLNTVTQVQYKVVVPSTSEARTSTITFACTGLDGVEVSSSKTIVTQAAPTAEITALQTYTNFKSTGGFDLVDFVVANPDSEGLILSTDSPYITELTINTTTTEGDFTTYKVWIEGNVEYTGETKLTQYVKLSYTTTGGDYAELLYPVYIYPSTWGYISPYNEILKLKADGTPETSTYTYLGCGYNGMSVIDTPVSDVDWFTITTYTVDDGTSTADEVRRWAYTAEPNDGAERRANISYAGTDSKGNAITAMSVIVQAAAEDYEEPDDPDTPDLPSNSYDTTIAPIWMDTEYVWGSQESTVFTISIEVPYFIPHLGVRYEEEVIYKGKAWRKPDDDRIKVLINKICQNYFNDSDLPLNTSVGVEGGYMKFLLRTESGLLLHTYYFVNDWSYKTLKLGLKTDPIIPNIVDGQRLFFSSFAHDEQMGFEWGMSYYNGTPDYTNVEYVKNDLYTVIVPPSRTKGTRTFRFGNRSYSMIPACSARYVLYYHNPYGGWDWFPIMGTVKRTDNLTQYSYTKNYNNTTLDFGKTRYLSEINVKYVMNTGWLTQVQSDRMWELLESNSVYMHDLKTDEIRPMVITDTQVEHKQKNRQNKIIQYAINLEESQTRERM